uniref:Uncharacterized protein n=1 Tax=Anguilla anguilla TaxID=7936 RepID=A0A0E9TSK3_ANGAN
MHFCLKCTLLGVCNLNFFNVLCPYLVTKQLPA